MTLILPEPDADTPHDPAGLIAFCRKQYEKKHFEVTGTVCSWDELEIFQQQEFINLICAVYKQGYNQGANDY